MEVLWNNWKTVIVFDSVQHFDCNKKRMNFCLVHTNLDVRPHNTYTSNFKSSPYSVAFTDKVLMGVSQYNVPSPSLYDVVIRKYRTSCMGRRQNDQPVGYYYYYYYLFIYFVHRCNSTIRHVK
jgi:hypothetical protein